MRRKVSECLAPGESPRRQSVRVSKKNQEALIFLFLSFFCYSLFTVYCSLSYAESLSDIKMDALDAHLKEKWGRDPFVKQEVRLVTEGGVKEDVPLDLKVDGIISDGDKALAIINGGFYRKNEKVGDFLIVGIEKDKVTIEKNGKRFSLGIEKFAIEGTQKGGKK